MTQMKLVTKREVTDADQTLVLMRLAFLIKMRVWLAFLSKKVRLMSNTLCVMPAKRAKATLSSILRQVTRPCSNARAGHASELSTAKVINS